MDVFHRVLTRIYEISGGRDTQEVDFIELLKKEGFYANRESIKDHLSTEGWITDTPRQDHVRLTHWGMAEAKKSLSGSDQDDQEIVRNVEKIKTAARDLAAFADELSAGSGAAALKPVEERVSEINALISQLKRQL